MRIHIYTVSKINWTKVVRQNTSKFTKTSIGLFHTRPSITRCRNVVNLLCGLFPGYFDMSGEIWMFSLLFSRKKSRSGRGETYHSVARSSNSLFSRLKGEENCVWGFKPTMPGGSSGAVRSSGDGLSQSICSIFVFMVEQWFSGCSSMHSGSSHFVPFEHREYKFHGYLFLLAL